ncbi:MAG: cytochrome P450 [Myxococcota bacterium]|nr:cytochrome P450 [Myxococcota bacterium]
MSAAAELPLQELDVITPDSFQQNGYPHEAWKRLRHEAPIHFFDSSELPFWAITKHADITAISKQPELFLSRPRLFVNLRVEELQARGEFVDRPPTLIEMDNPEHRAYRKIIIPSFTPGALKKIHADVDRIARKIVEDLLAEGEGEVDFVDKVAAPLPIAVIGWLLGVPEADWPKLYDWTNRMVGFDDPEFNPTDLENEGTRALIELFTYFNDMVEARRRDPKDDLVSLFTHAEVDGKKLPQLDVLSYCQVIVGAGNETTRNATSGGMLALIQNPDERRKLADPANLRTGVEEILRWTSPIIHFARTARHDTEFNGHQFKKGDVVALYYPSANRDEDVFEDPYAFRVDRQPNRHLAFGVGEHFCAGAHVARLELEMAFKYLLPRLEEIELLAEPDRLRSNLIGGIKRLPIRFKARSA